MNGLMERCIMIDWKALWAAILDNDALMDFVAAFSLLFAACVGVWGSIEIFFLLASFVGKVGALCIILGAITIIPTYVLIVEPLIKDYRMYRDENNRFK